MFKPGMYIALLQETPQLKRIGAVFVFSCEGIKNSEKKELIKKFD